MIKISVPNDDEAALQYFGEAMIKLAASVRGEGPVNVRVEPITLKLDDEALARLQQATQDLMKAAPAMLKDNDVDGSIEVHGKRKQAEVDSTSQQVESLVNSLESSLSELMRNTHGKVPHSDNVPEFIKEAGTRAFAKTLNEAQENGVLSITTDSTGTPWDERIHSASKALNSDGTWRVRRKPADKTPEEWADYIKWVEEDIHTVQHGQSIDDWADEEIAKLDNPEPPVTPQGDDFHVDAGEVTEQEVASIPAPPPPPVVTVSESTAPFGHEYAHYTFPQVMQFLTERHGRITSPQVDQIIADMGLNSIMDIRDNTEHAGPFIARVKALLGE